MLTQGYTPEEIHKDILVTIKKEIPYILAQSRETISDDVFHIMEGVWAESGKMKTVKAAVLSLAIIELVEDLKAAESRFEKALNQLDCTIGLKRSGD